MTPGTSDFWFLPLGGCGEIGMNLNLYGHAGQWLMVDCGVTFEKSPVPGGGNRVEMPDPMFIANRSEALVGLIATHAHEDHIGAIAHLWEQLRCPIYTTPFTRNVLLRKLREKGIAAPVLTVHPGETVALGAFHVSWLPITHSTPETHALLIETAAGTLLHTADWKLDDAPIAGPAIQPSLFERLARRRVDAIVCDSTNATQPGHSVSEGELFEGLLAAVRSSEGRVVVSCFASNIARLQTLGHVARLSGRYLGLLGRALETLVSCARGAGYLQDDFAPVQAEHLGYLPPGEVLALATGSQGEPGAALHRLALDSHPCVSLAAGDHVLFSAKTIPGNEEAVARLIAAFEARQIRVTHPDRVWLPEQGLVPQTARRPLHASGHPCADELAQMYAWVRPRLAIPVHGEPHHLRANAAIAREAGVPLQAIGSNGDLFDLLSGRITRGAAPVGRLWLEERKGLLHRC
jgi:ribonuclease J